MYGFGSGQSGSAATADENVPRTLCSERLAPSYSIILN